jgi:hypothetical protein
MHSAEPVRGQKTELAFAKGIITHCHAPPLTVCYKATADHLRPQLPNETVLDILTYALVRSGFCAPHLPTEALQLAILATLFNSLQKRQQRGVAAKMLNFTLF